MALAIKLDEQVRQGVFRDYAEIARLGYVTRARLTQIVNLTHLAANIQEELLHMVGEGPTERQIRSIAAEVDWEMQTRSWQKFRHVRG
jgi:hypothetical protein